jgi:predicted choloylglycine hydrolase
MSRNRVLLAILILVLLLAPARGADQTQYTEGKHGKGELRVINGLPVLIVEGTPEEMGEQAGQLVKSPLKRVLGAAPTMLKLFGYADRMKEVLKTSNAMVPQFPPEHLRELETLIKTAGVDRDLLFFGQTFPDITKIGGCSTLIVDPERSATGKPMFGRNLDYPTFGLLERYSLVVVYRPKGKHAFAAVTFPGMVGVISAMNDAGLAVAALESYSSKDEAPRFDPEGVPYILIFRRMMEECTTVAEAEKLLRSVKRATMNNLAICDKKGGAVFEITSKSVVIRRPERGLCPCTNHFRSPELYTDKTCKRYDALSKAFDMDKVDMPTVAKLMDSANQGAATLQTMVFEPATLELHLAIGKCPTSKLPLRDLPLAPLLASGKKP